LTFSLKELRFYVSEILVALEMMHKHDYIYRDLKLENLMISNSGHVKIVDMGLCIKTKGRAHTCCGTPGYMAPEVL
jgi:serine/threonine protein kinase